jgi:hypothetical protein
LKRRPEAAVAALLVLGLLVAGGGAWLRSRHRPPDVTSLLPPRGLLATLSGDALGRRIADLRGVALYRVLLDLSPRGALPPRLGWRAGVPDPAAVVPRDGSSALGIYRGGWVLETSAEIAVDGAVRRDGGALVASSPSLLAEDAAAAPWPGEPADPGSLRFHARHDGSFRGAGPRLGPLLERWAPREIDGTMRYSSGNVRERFLLTCAGRCILDALDPSGDADLSGPAAAAALPGATSVAAFRLAPSALLDSLEGEGSGRGDLLSEIGRLEGFLDLPIRKDLAASLRGPGVAAVLRDPRAGDAVVVGLELKSPGTARALLDRVAAVGALTGSASLVQYRGVPVVTWSGGRRLHGLEPSAGIDGDLLVLALRPSDLEEVIDRRRDGRTAPPEALRSDLRALPSGPWKGATRTTTASTSWESLLRGSGAVEEVRIESRAVLYRRSRGWILEGGGRSPAILADGVTPAIVRAALRSGS